MNTSLVNFTSPQTTNMLPISSYPDLIVCIFGTITNSLNIYVFLSNITKFKHQIFTFMLITSSVDLVYCALLIYNNWAMCKTCQLYTTYFTQLYTIIVFDYITSCLAIFNILIDIIVSFERYLIVLNSKYLRNISLTATILIVSVLSLLYYLPVLFMKNIELIKSTNSFRLELNNFGSSRFAEILIIVIQSIRIFLTVILLPSVNILTAIQLRKILKVRSIISVQKRKLSIYCY